MESLESGCGDSERSADWMSCLVSELLSSSESPTCSKVILVSKRAASCTRGRKSGPVAQAESLDSVSPLLGASVSQVSSDIRRAILSELL